MRQMVFRGVDDNGGGDGGGNNDSGDHHFPTNCQPFQAHTQTKCKQLTTLFRFNSVR